MSYFLRRRNVSASKPVVSAPTVLSVVAHQDDDLYFMNPDLLTDIDNGYSAVTVYLTAGDHGESATYWQGRELGAQAAYSQMLNSSEPWSITTQTFAGKVMHVASIERATLIFLRLPDGGGFDIGYAATGYQAISRLWYGTAASISAVDGSNTFTKLELLACIAAISNAYAPRKVRTLEGLMNGVHYDHRTTARFTISALAGKLDDDVPLLSYRDYTVSSEPENVSEPLYSRKLAALTAYEPYDYLVAPLSVEWMKRQYTAPLTAPSHPMPGSASSERNLAAQASILVSSQNSNDSQFGINAIDGVIDGYPGDYTKEWASLEESQGLWIELRWNTPQLIDRVYLYDRPNTNDHIRDGTLSFSDGSTIGVGALENDGSATIVTFTARSCTWLRFTSTGGVGANTGLSEIEVYNGTP